MIDSAVRLGLMVIAAQSLLPAGSFATLGGALSTATTMMTMTGTRFGGPA